MKKLNYLIIPLTLIAVSTANAFSFSDEVDNVQSEVESVYTKDNVAQATKQVQPRPRQAVKTPQRAASPKRRIESDVNVQGRADTAAWAQRRADKKKVREAKAASIARADAEKRRIESDKRAQRRAASPIRRIESDKRAQRRAASPIRRIESDVNVKGRAETAAWAKRRADKSKEFRNCKLTIIYTELADPLLAYIDADIANSSTSASALLTPINYNADLFANEAKFFTGNYGFEGYIGVPDLAGSNGQQAAANFNIAWETLDPALNPALRALTSGASVLGASGVYGTQLQLQDTMPLVFSYPVLPTTLNQDGSDFEVVLNDGSIVKPLIAAFLPNVEHNERQTVVIIGEFGNRDLPGTPDARYPVSVRVVNDGTPLQMLSANGPVDAVGLNIASKNPYETGNGPKLVAAKLNYFSPLGEGAPNANQSSLDNSGANLYGNEAQYRLRLYTSAGFSPDGIASLLPNDFSNYFILESRFGGDSIEITEAGRSYEVGDLGSIKVIGLADLAPAGTTVNDAYVEDHDNYYDIILKGDLAAIQSLQSVRMPSSGEYQAVYNPGGPGNNPNAPGAASGPFTVASEDHTIPITLDLDGAMQATYVEVDGQVLRNPWNLQPVGTLLGLAVQDTESGQEINAYVDPDGRRFFSSFSPSSDIASDLPGNQTSLNPIDLIDTTNFSADSVVSISGSISRSANDNSIVQFYAINNADGEVTDPISGSILLPDEPGYADAATNYFNLIENQLRLADTSINSFEFTLEAGKLYAPVVINETHNEIYFAFADANSDGLEHFNGIGANGWGIEDTFGGGDSDFDDMIVRFNVSSY